MQNEFQPKLTDKVVSYRMLSKLNVFYVTANVDDFIALEVIKSLKEKSDIEQ